MSRLHSHSSVPVRRFRTDSEGNIPLSRDWFGLFTQTRRLGRVVIQTRNTGVRLITLGSAPALAWSAGRGLARDDRSGLTLRPSRWGQARGRLAHCTCCGSAGNIRFFDLTGVECLQLCAHPDTEPAAWADFLAPFTASPNASHHPLPAGLFCTGTDFNVLSDTVLHDPGLLLVLLDLFAANNTPLVCTLHTPGAIRHRTLIPRRISSLHGLLTVTDAATTLQIALPAIRHLAVHPSKIDLVGIDGTSLLSLSPAGGPPAARLWSAILNTALNRS